MFLIIIKEEMHQPDALIHLIIVAHSQLLDYTDLAFSYLSERVIIIEIVIIFIIKPVLLKL